MTFSTGALLVLLFGILITVRTLNTVTQQVVGVILIILALLVAGGYVRFLG